jgi:hypothetical protein
MRREDYTARREVNSTIKTNNSTGKEYNSTIL